MKNTIILTREKGSNKEIITILKKSKITAYEMPCIEIAQKKINKKEISILKKIDDFDWIVFTSVNGVKYFSKIIKKENISARLSKVAAVGPSTATEIKHLNIKLNFVPKVFTSENLARTLPKVDGKKILLIRASEASSELPKILKKRGATITDIAVYQTKLIRRKDYKYYNILRSGIKSIVFMSPTAVKGFIGRINKKDIKSTLKIKIISIGPATSKEAKRGGFNKVYTASPHNLQGVIKLIIKKI